MINRYLCLKLSSATRTVPLVCGHGFGSGVTSLVLSLTFLAGGMRFSVRYSVRPRRSIVTPREWPMAILLEERATA